MCTVSFLPYKNGFLLTSSRDEALARETILPRHYQHNDLCLVYPKDALAGGTWVAASAQKRVVCLLNGAFEKHLRRLPYSRSRGQVLLESFDYQCITTFCSQTDLENVEPFTLILIDTAKTPELLEMRWDGIEKHIKKLSFSQPFIWSSATLYDASAREQREKWFFDWLSLPAENAPLHILNFHTSKHGNDTKNDVLMQREGGLQTLSISQIQVQTDAETAFYYKDWIAQTEHKLIV